MTETVNTFKRMLWPIHGVYAGMSDQFVVGGFRVQLVGNALEISSESDLCSQSLAEVLGERYVKALSSRLLQPIELLTEDEWLARTSPPFGGNLLRFPCEQVKRSRVVNAVKEARNEILSDADGTLRECYNYLQDARERLVTAHTSDEAKTGAYEAYKVLEMLIGRFGDEGKTKRALGRVFERAKRSANDIRHLGRNGSTPEEAVGLTQQVIQKYEQYLLNQN